VRVDRRSCRGRPASERIRGYLKAISKAGWQLVSWLTHAENAARVDAEFAISATEDILSMFGAALIRQRYAIPAQCPECGSYQIGLRKHPEGSDGADPVPGCRACGWITPLPRREERPKTAAEIASVWDQSCGALLRVEDKSAVQPDPARAPAASSPSRSRRR
jgi:hypothetical protein